MDLTAQFDQVAQDLTQLRQLLADTVSQPMDDDMRAYLERVLHALDEQFAEAQKVFPDAAREIDRVRTEAKATQEEANRKISAVRAKDAEQEKAEALSAAGVVTAAAGAVAATAPAPPRIDPGLGEKLRDELLSLCGVEVAPLPAGSDPGSVWQFCSQLGIDEPEASTPKPKARRTRKTKPPRPASPPGSEAWEGLSGLDDQ
jgi:hypothetical protein